MEALLQFIETKARETSINLQLGILYFSNACILGIFYRIITCKFWNVIISRKAPNEKLVSKIRSSDVYNVRYVYGIFVLF